MDSEQYTDIKVQYENRVARISINRPDKLNAIRLTTYRELISALEAADNSNDCNIILLEGCGDHFTAGNDLADLISSEHNPPAAAVRN